MLLRKMIVVLVVVIVAALGCARPHGKTVEEKRDFVDSMAMSTIDELYLEKLHTKQLMKDAEGYGVFSDINTQFLFFGGGSGYGVVVDNKTGKKTYMRMVEAGAGLGLAIKDFREIIFFMNRDTMNRFVTSGWDFGVQGDVVLKYDEEGGAATPTAYSDVDMIVYQLTKKGIALRVNFGASKFWRDGDLN